MILRVTFRTDKKDVIDRHNIYIWSLILYFFVSFSRMNATGCAHVKMGSKSQHSSICLFILFIDKKHFFIARVFFPNVTLRCRIPVTISITAFLVQISKLNASTFAIIGHVEDLHPLDFKEARI